MTVRCMARHSTCLTLAVVTATLAATSPAAGQQPPIELTLERMVELGLRDSYRVRQLLLDIDRTRAQLRAEEAALKSRVELRLNAPRVEAISDYKWNSTLQQNELVHEDTRRWQADLSVSQPVILFGYPTNGRLSLNNRMYRYSQADEDDRDIRFYNRYFLAYEQPLFQHNRMKTDLEQAKLELESTELEFQSNIVRMVDDLADDYFDLFEAAYERVLSAERLDDLQEAAAAARDVVQRDSSRAIELDQLQVAIANAREAQQRAASKYRLESTALKQTLRLSAADSIVVDPVLEVRPVEIDPERAVEYAATLAPRMRQLDINRRRGEIRLSQTRGNNSFRVNVGVTYGREVQDPRFQNLWTEPRNSYTVNIDAFVPLWDWGARKYRIQAQEYAVQRTDISIEQARTEIETNIRNQLLNLQEYEQRALNMHENLAFAEQITTTTLERYRRGEVTLVDVLQTIEREASTAANLLDAYLGYQNALLNIQQATHYDFERNTPLLERFRVGQLAERR